MSNELKNYCMEIGITRELIQPPTPQQNSASNRRNRTIIKCARSISQDCNLLLFLWSEALATANYLISRSPTQAKLGVTLEERFSIKQPNIEHL